MSYGPPQGFPDPNQGGYPGQQPPGYGPPAYGQPISGPPAGYGPPPGYGGGGQIGKIRPTGISILLFVVTCGIYGIIWWYLVHEEIKKHTGQGLGGVLAAVIAFLLSPVAAFMTADEVGKMYVRRGQVPPPVNAMTGLWYFPGMFIIVGPIIWFVKTNAAINDYWASLGARPS